jgi:hypothetical protein
LRPARRLAALALVAILLAATAASLAPVAASAPAAGGPSMRLVHQDARVGPSGEFSMRLHVEPAGNPSRLEVALTVFPGVATRSAFALTLTEPPTGPALLPTQPFPLADLAADPNGDVNLAIRFGDRLSLGHDDGVFPVRVDLRERGSGRVAQRFTTHLVYLPVANLGPKLGVSLVLPFHAPPGLPAAGGRQLKGVEQLVAVPAALDALGTTPAALAPTPETLATLAAGADERDVTLLRGLQQRAANMTVLAGTYVPTSLPALLGAGLGTELAAQVDRGTTVVGDVLRARPDARTWLAREPLDDSSLALLATRGFDRVVTPETQLQPLATQKITLTQTFRLRTRGDHPIDAAVADTGLSSHFDNRIDPVLAANQFLADLAVLFLDQPGAERRAVVAVAPREWKADRQFLDTAVAGLAQSPILETISLDGLFSSVPWARGDDGRPLVRSLAVPRTPALNDIAGDVRTARRRLDALASVLGTSAAVQATLEERLLLAESAELRTTRQRQPYLNAVMRGVDAQTHEIRPPNGRSITLTARRGEIPVTFQNRTGVSAKVVVKVQSDKLDFPRGTTQLLELTRRNTTERFPVVLRTSGAFPLRITLESPDGGMVIGQARLTIRSTAASRVSLVVSLGAALFLAVWWGRHALRGRRARRLVPA